MKGFKLLLFGLYLSGVVSCNSSGKETSSDPQKYIISNWAHNDLWDDGMAEVAIYNAERVVYGKTRQFDYAYILVKETFNEEFHVKTDDYGRNDLYEVMKVNKFCRIPTLAYPYHYLTSVFLHRDEPNTVHKLTNTSQEWCGNTAKSFLEEEDSYTFNSISYWDGQGNGTDKVLKGPWFEDQLSYTLRALKFEDGLRFTINLYPTQVSNKAITPETENTKISVQKADLNEIDSTSAAFVSDPWKVFVTREKGPDLTFWINGEYPNYLLQMEATDGRRLSLKSLKRDDYWAKE